MEPKKLKQAINAFGTPLSWLRVGVAKGALIISNGDLFVKVHCTVTPELLVQPVSVHTKVRDLKQAFAYADFDSSKLELKLVDDELNLGALGQAVFFGLDETPSYEYPDLGQGQPVSIPIAEMYRAQSFTSTDFSNRVTLTGVYLDMEHVVATDGHRLIRIARRIPKKVQRTIIKANISKRLGLEHYYQGDNWLAASNEEQTIIARVNDIDGEYPDYNRTIPDYTNYSSVQINAAEFKKACGLAKRTHQGEAFKPFILTQRGFAINNTLYLFDEPFPFDFDPLGLNSVYVADVLKDAGKLATITLHIAPKPFQGCLFTFDDTLHLVMPMRVAVIDDQFDLTKCAEYKLADV
jgi:hypothetical protein